MVLQKILPMLQTQQEFRPQGFNKWRGSPKRNEMKNPQGGFVEKIGETGSRDPEVPDELKNGLQKQVNQNIRPKVVSS